MRGYKYKTRFDAIARCLVDEEADKFLAKASLENLKPLLPKDINWDENVDLLPIVANGTTINRANRNGHLITYKEAPAVARNSRYKLLDIEHKRDKITGVIISAGFSQLGTNNILTEEDIKELKDPFYMSVAAAIYKVSYPELIEKVIKSNDPGSSWYQQISLSWEVGYTDYYLLKGSKNLTDGTLITDLEQIEELTAKYLTKKDKDGKESRRGFGKMADGTPLYTVLTGEDLVLLGYGLVLNPAAEVQGLLTLDNTNLTLIEKDEEEKATTTTSNSSDSIIVTNTTNEKPVTTNNADIEVTQQLNEVNKGLNLSIEAIKNFSEELSKISKEKNIPLEDVTKEILANYSQKTVTENDIQKKKTSHKKIVSVKKGDMKFESEKDFTKALKEVTASAELPEEFVEASNKFVNQISEQLREFDKKYTAEKKAKEEGVAQVKAEAEKLKEDLKKVQNDLAQANESLNKMNEERAAQEKQEKFDSRFAALDETYELDDETRKVIASQIKDLDDEGYNKWFEAFKVFAAAKSKEAIAQAQKDADELAKARENKEDKSKAGEVVEASLKGAQVVSAPVPNSSTPNTSLKDKYKNLNVKDHIEFKR